MVPAFKDDDRMRFDCIHQPMLIVDPPRPITGKISFQWLRFTDSIERRSSTILNQLINPFLEFFYRFVANEGSLPNPHCGRAASFLNQRSFFDVFPAVFQVGNRSQQTFPVRLAT